MALSPNYGFPEPDNSSLVKNGAQDIRALGDAIDTSVWNVGFGQAGKNKIINGNFGVNQRSFTTSATTGAYSFDRWQQVFAGGTQTVTPQNFTAGAAPVAGYEGRQFAQVVTATQSAAGDYSAYTQKIESVRTFAGQTVTVSFWAKASTGTPNIGVSGLQNFGTGGSPSANVIVAAATPVVAISASWLRYSFVLTVPSISGKTIGTNNDDHFRIDIWTSAGTTISGLGYPAVGIQNITAGIWGVQAEYGSKMTPFQTASGGSPQAELAMCQRYYYRANSSNAYGIVGSGIGYNSTTCAITTALPVSMRVVPSSVDFSTLSLFDIVGGNNTVTTCTLDTNQTTFNTGVANISAASGITNYRTYYIRGNASSSAYIAYNAEL